MDKHLFAIQYHVIIMMAHNDHRVELMYSCSFYNTSVNFHMIVNESLALVGGREARLKKK